MRPHVAFAILQALRQRRKLESSEWRKSFRCWRGEILAFTFSRRGLFQVADMIATLELVRLKLETEGRISDAEKEFFLSIQNLKKNFLKPTARKRHE